MTYSINYISYNEDDQELKNRSTILLNNFFSNKDYLIQDTASGIVFVASGGSEQYAKAITKKTHSIILLCHRESNSFAATMEIGAYLRAEGKRVSIIDVLAPQAFDDFLEIQKVHQAIEQLKGQKAALIGEISDWLIVSDMHESLLHKKLGIEFSRIAWDQLDDYRQQESSADFLAHFPKHDQTELSQTAKLYTLLESVVKQKALSAISVECFSVVMRDKVTACLPLAVLSTHHTVAACEGDVCSMIGQMIVRSLSGLVPWQANIAEIKEDSILFAHCTAPLNSLTSFNITTHFETNCGTAIQGAFKKGSFGAFRINTSFDKYMLIEGEITNTPTHNFACRTQIEFKTTAAQSALLKNKALGNHHLIVPAASIPLLNRMMQELQIEKVV